MPFKKPTIVIFDMDGTTVRHINPWVLHVLEKIDDWSFKIGTQLRSIKNAAAKNRKMPKKMPHLLVHRAMHKLRRKPVEEIVQPCDGIYNVLNFLKAHNVALGLASNGLGKGYGHDILEKFGLSAYFRASIFRDDIHRAKPDPEGILLTLERMGITLTAQDHIWYIGDRHKDITAAQAAQAHLPCKIVPLAYGLNASLAVLDNFLDPSEHIILSYGDLLRRLQKILGPVPTQHLDPKAAHI